MAATGDTLLVLTVCTGNICRSPLAAQLLGAADLPVPLAVESAGTYARAGEGMDAPAAALARELGLDPAAHVARQLTAEHVERADLVLAMAREHRRDVVSLVPRATRYAFTLTEFAALLADLAATDPAAVTAALAGADAAGPAERMRALIPVVAAHRGQLPPGAATEYDVPDPYGGPQSAHRLAAERIAQAVDSIAGSLHALAEVARA